MDYPFEMFRFRVRNPDPHRLPRTFKTCHLREKDAVAQYEVIERLDDTRIVIELPAPSTNAWQRLRHTLQSDDVPEYPIDL